MSLAFLCGLFGYTRQAYYKQLRQWIDDESFENFRQAQGRIDEIIHIYNSLRPHASCDWLTPMEAERRTGKLERHWCRKSVLQKTSVNSYQDNIFLTPMVIFNYQSL